MVTAARPTPPFRLGEQIRIEFQTTRDCHVTLIDLGTGGGAAVVLPNA